MERFKNFKQLKITNDYSLFTALDTKNNIKVSIKKINQKFNNWENVLNYHEIKILSMLSHPNIVALKEIIMHQNSLYLVMDYLEITLNGYYEFLIQKEKKIPELEIQNIIFNIAKAIHYLETKDIVHGDISSYNIFIYKDKVKLACFDNSIKLDQYSKPRQKKKNIVQQYPAPEEIIKQDKYSFKSDIFSLGCLMAELFNQTPLFLAEDEISQLAQYSIMLGKPKKSDWSQGYEYCENKSISLPESQGINLKTVISDASDLSIELMQQMLKFNISKRIDAKKILENPIFEDFEDSIIEPNIYNNPLQQNLNFQSDIQLKNKENQQILQKYKSNLINNYQQAVNEEQNYNLNKDNQNKLYKLQFEQYVNDYIPQQEINNKQQRNKQIYYDLDKSIANIELNITSRNHSKKSPQDTYKQEKNQGEEQNQQIYNKKNQIQAPFFILNQTFDQNNSTIFKLQYQSPDQNREYKNNQQLSKSKFNKRSVSFQKQSKIPIRISQLQQLPSLKQQDEQNISIKIQKSISPPNKIQNLMHQKFSLTPGKANKDTCQINNKIVFQQDENQIKQNNIQNNSQVQEILQLQNNYRMQKLIKRSNFITMNKFIKQK